MEHKEIERKFLVELDKVPGNLEDHRSVYIRQSYPLICDEGELRIRSKDASEELLTIKSTGNVTRDEFEIVLTVQQAEVLKPLMNGRMVVKRRYYVTGENREFELDVYKEKLEGLNVVEVEFDSRDQAKSFDPPSWFGVEVSEVAWLKNRSLCKQTYGQIKQKLRDLER